MTGFGAQTHVALIHTTHPLRGVGFSTVVVTVGWGNVTTLTRTVQNVKNFFFSRSLFKDAIFTHEQAFRIFTFPERTAPYTVQKVKSQIQRSSVNTNILIFTKATILNSLPAVVQCREVSPELMYGTLQTSLKTEKWNIFARVFTGAEAKIERQTYRKPQLYFFSPRRNSPPPPMGQGLLII